MFLTQNISTCDKRTAVLYLHRFSLRLEMHWHRCNSICHLTKFEKNIARFHENHYFNLQVKCISLKKIHWNGESPSSTSPIYMHERPTPIAKNGGGGGRITQFLKMCCKASMSKSATPMKSLGRVSPTPRWGPTVTNFKDLNKNYFRNATNWKSLFYQLRNYAHI